jgi:hypothetical protein
MESNFERVDISNCFQPYLSIPSGSQCLKQYLFDHLNNIPALALVRLDITGLVLSDPSFETSSITPLKKLGGRDLLSQQTAENENNRVTK